MTTDIKLPPLPLALFDEFGKGADDRVQDYARTAVLAALEAAAARIKAADDAAADSDYMLDSKDCISVLRGAWQGPLAMDRPDRADRAERAAPLDDLAHTVRRLAHALRQAAPSHDLPAKALDYLQRQGLLASVLRDGEEPAEVIGTQQKYLCELADRIDHEKLWRWAGMDHDKMTPEQKDRMHAGVNLRRYADLLGSETWRILPPRPNMGYRAGTLDAVYEMAKRSEEQRNSIRGAEGSNNG